jgi:hypothetical protein
MIGWPFGRAACAGRYSVKRLLAQRGDFKLTDFPPVSTPEKPAARLSLRHVSNVVSPPNSGKSSFDQAIGAIPSLAFIFVSEATTLVTPSALLSDANALFFAAFVLVMRRSAHALARARLGNANIPPGIARGPDESVRHNREDSGPICALGPFHRRAEFDQTLHATRQRTHRFCMFGEIDRERLLDPAVLYEVVE